MQWRVVVEYPFHAATPHHTGRRFAAITAQNLMLRDSRCQFTRYTAIRVMPTFGIQKKWQKHCQRLSTAGAETGFQAGCAVIWLLLKVGHRSIFFPRNSNRRLSMIPHLEMLLKMNQEGNLSMNELVSYIVRSISLHGDKSDYENLPCQVKKSISDRLKKYREDGSWFFASHTGLENCQKHADEFIRKVPDL